MKTGNTSYASNRPYTVIEVPQWSPVMKTGNTLGRVFVLSEYQEASMEPGHEDREYAQDERCPSILIEASMEPGHEDREYLQSRHRPPRRRASLNGARS